MSRSNKISTLWIEGRVRNIDHVCLASMCANNLDVSLYSYGNISNVPSGVKIEDANNILDIGLLERLQCIKNKKLNPHVPIAQFSDFFRIMLQKENKGLWLDTDVFIFKPFTYDTNKVFFFHEGKGRIGYPVIYLPPGNKIISEYENLMTKDKLMPNWLGFLRGKLKPFIWNLTNQEYSSSDLGITIYGNDGFSRLAKRHNYFNLAGPKNKFFYWTGKKNWKLFEEEDFSFFIENPEILGIHIHKKHWQVPPKNIDSFWKWAYQKYGGEIEN